MKYILKTFVVILITALALSILSLWFNTFIVDRYYLHGSIFMNVLIGLGVPLLISLGSFYSIKSVIKL